jgi:hypothetical protein
MLSPYEFLPVIGGTNAPPKKSRNQISTLTSQNILKSGIGVATMQAQIQ